MTDSVDYLIPTVFNKNLLRKIWRFMIDTFC
jgi:hypothetical protein